MSITQLSTVGIGKPDMSGFRMVDMAFENRTFFSLDRFIYKEKFVFFIKRSRLVQTIQLLDVKTSGFRMNLYLEWSDFGSPLYYTTYQALQLFCPVTKRWSLTLANIYHKVYDVSRLWNSPITQYRAWIESWMSLPFNRSSVVW